MLQGFLASVVVGLSAGIAAQSVAQDAPEPLLEIRFVGVDSIDVAPKDRAALNALRMAGARLSELPEELEGDDEPGPLILAGWSAMLGGTGLEIIPSNGPPGVAAAITFTPTAPHDADSLVNLLAQIAQEQGAPVQFEEGVLTLPTPMGPATLVSDGRGANIRFGTEQPASTEAATYGLPADARGILSFRVRTQQIMQMVLPFLGAEIPTVTAPLEMMGLAGPEAPSVFEGAVGSTGKHLYVTQRVYGGANSIENWSLSSETVFQPNDLWVVPEDATRVVAVAADLGHLIRVLEEQAAQFGSDPFEAVREQTGLDLKRGVLENIGPRVIMYQSETTGGGGALSTVLIADLADEQAFVETHSAAKAMLNALAAENAEGYVGITEWEHARGTAFTLSTPGIPVPLEISWSVHDGRFVLAGSPIGLITAIEQIDNPASSVVQNPRFRDSAGELMNPKGVSTLMYSDSEFFARRGYGMLNLALSGLRNGIRSRDGSRDPGVLMPTFTEFVRDIEPFGSVSYVDGDDYFTIARGDRSILVHSAGVLSNMGGGQGSLAAVGGLGAGLFLPAVARAESSAKQIKSATQVRALVQAAIIFSNDADDQFPGSVEVLVDELFIDQDLLESPYGPASDGGPDVVLRTGYEATYSGLDVVAMDRAMWINGHDVVNVGFGDTRVEAVSRWELEELLAEPNNAGVAELFGIQFADPQPGGAPNW